MKKKLYGSVLLIGGGLGFTQSSSILQSRLESSLPVEFSKGSDTVEVSSNPRVCHVSMNECSSKYVYNLYCTHRTLMKKVKKP